MVSDVYDAAFALFDVPRAQLSARDGKDDSPYQGVIFLSNVNASYSTAPQPYWQYDASIPTAEGTHESLECYSANNCTLPSGEPASLYQTEYDEFGCQGSATSYMLPNVTYDGTGCYNWYDSSYVRYSCAEEHTTMATYHYGSSCDVPPSVTVFTRGVCSEAAKRTQYCLVAPYSPPSPSDSALIRPALLALFGLVGSLMLLL
jgi:hypothetical protein